MKSNIRRSIKGSFLSALTVLLCTPANTAWAAPSGLNQAVQTFNSKQYSKALGQLEAISRANPSDALTHYYMGLCYHYLNQVGSAAQQYQWVATYSSDGRLRAQAQNALMQLGRYQANRTYQGQGGIAGGMTASAASPTRASGGRLKVLEFYTDWCGPCKKFAPEFHQLQSDFGSKVAFQSLNAEDGGAGSDLAERYKVNSYPTVIYVDGSGQVLDRQSGASYDSVASRINKLLGTL